jgi:CrcB protein
MSGWILVAIGSALGGVTRHGVGLLIAQRFGSTFPWGTLAVNVLGSCAIGMCGAWLIDSQRASAPLIREFAMVGFLGGFTTFSAFSLQTLQLLRDGKATLAIANVAASIVLCLFAVWLGFALASRGVPAH